MTARFLSVVLRRIRGMRSDTREEISAAFGWRCIGTPHGRAGSRQVESSTLPRAFVADQTVDSVRSSPHDRLMNALAFNDPGGTHPVASCPSRLPCGTFGWRCIGTPHGRAGSRQVESSTLPRAFVADQTAPAPPLPPAPPMPPMPPVAATPPAPPPPPSPMSAAGTASATSAPHAACTAATANCRSPRRWWYPRRRRHRCRRHHRCRRCHRSPRHRRHPRHHQAR